jgi:hypothetical protein
VSAALEVDQTQLNRLFLNLVRIGETHGVRFPREFGLFLKQLLYFDRYTRILAPQLQVRSEMCSCLHHTYGVLLMLHLVLYFDRYTRILVPQLQVRNEMCSCLHHKYGVLLMLHFVLYFGRYTRILVPQLQVRSEMCSCSHHKYGVLLMLHFVLYFHRYTHILAPQLYVRNKMCGKCNVWCAPVPEKAIILWPLHAFWRHSYRCGVIVCACS